MSTVTDIGANMARRRKATASRGPYDAVAIEFGKRLQHFTADKGWNQADLAREASKHLAGSKQFRRDNISLYTRGIQMPGPARLRALCKALGVHESDLVPEAVSSTAESPPLALKPMDGTANVWLQVNQAVSMEMALEIAAILRKRDGTK
jgi:transcriptional regulator with XRE-family HTH domain